MYDIDIQKRENDLVVATFGRGFYVLDNYTPLRQLSTENLNKEAYLFPIKDALLYIPSSPLGLSGTGSQGADLWSAPNPEFGATFTFYQKSVQSTLKDEREKAQNEAEKNKTPAEYPTFEQLWNEENEDKAQLIWIIRDSNDKEIKRITTSPKKGITRVSWDLRMETTSPIKIHKPKPGRYSGPDVGFLVAPGTYSLEIVSEKDGKVMPLIEKTIFKVVGLENQTLVATNKDELIQFRTEVAETKRVLDGAGKLLSETDDRLKLIEFAVRNYPSAPLSLLPEIESIKIRMNECKKTLWGDWIRSSHEFETEPSIAGRLGMVEYQLFDNTGGVTKTQRENKAIAEEELAAFRPKLNQLMIELKAIENKLDAKKIPYTKARDENWKEEKE